MYNLNNTRGTLSEGDFKGKAVYTINKLFSQLMITLHVLDYLDEKLKIHTIIGYDVYDRGTEWSYKEGHNVVPFKDLQNLPEATTRRGCES